MVTTAPKPVPVMPSTAPVAATVSVSMKGVRGRGRRRFALVGEKVVVKGVVRPFVAQQRLEARIRRADGKMTSRGVSIVAGAGGAGRFSFKIPDGRAGNVRVDISHAPTERMEGFSIAPISLRVRSPDLFPGQRGPVVWLLQRDLASLHYAVPLSGVYESGTENALIAYRKVVGLPRLASAGRKVFSLLASRRGAFDVRFPHDGRHVEANLTQQVLAEIEPKGRVWRIYTISSGKPSTPTVLGRFRVYLKTSGINSEGMVYSNYFIRGYAIHGYAEVPTYPASHGCLRLPVEDAIPVYDWVRIGTIVDTYW